MPVVRFMTVITVLGSISIGQAAVTEDQLQRLTTFDNHVEIGLGHVSEQSARFGRYNALYDDGFFAILGLSYLYRSRYDAEDPAFLNIRIADAGLANRRVDLHGGRQGDYFIRAGYRERTARGGDGLQTIYNPQAGSNLQLPGNWVPAETTAGMTALLPSLHEFDLRQDRREISIGGGKHFAERWSVSTNFRQEDRDGQRAMAGMFGNTGGNPRAAFLPVPIDYRTRQIDLGVNYADRDRQLRLGYHGSLFSNNEPSLTFANPYSTITGWAAGSGHPQGRGQLALPPDNQFHQVSAAGGWNFSPSLRGLAELAIGRMTQDEDFLPLTANPVLAESIVQELPANSLDGRIDTTALNLRLTGRISRTFQWNASYRLDDRDNRTPSREFVTIGGDSQVQNVNATSSRRRFNLPYDYRNQRLRLDGTWRLPDRTRLTAAVQQQRINRSFTARARTDENLAELRLSRVVNEWLQAGLSGQWADRTGSRYDGAVGFLAGHDPAFTETLAGQWTNLPALRQFHLADRRRHRLGANAIVTPHEHWSIGLEAAAMQDDYRTDLQTLIGLAESSIRTWSTNISWNPDRNWSAYGFYTWEQLSAEQTGFSFRGGPNRLPDIANPDRLWMVDHRDRVDTAGLGFQRHWLDDRLTLAADLVYARARARLDVETGAALTSAPLPDINNRLRSLMLRGSYRINQPLTLHVRYWNERFSSSDWALDEVAVNQLANVILPGQTSPDYNVHVISAAVNYRF